MSSRRNGWNAVTMSTKSLLCKDLTATSHDIYEQAQSTWPSTCRAQAVERIKGSLGRQAPEVKIQQG